MRTEPATPLARRSRLRENILSLSALQAASYLLPLLTVPYLVQVLGAEKYGLIAFAQAFLQYFVVLTEYGFNLSASRDIARHRDEPSMVAAIFSSVILTRACLAAIGLGILSLIVFSVPLFRADWSLYLVGYLAVVGAVIAPFWLFQGMERMRAVVIISVIGRLAAVFALFILVRSPEDYRTALAIQAGTGVVIGVSCLVFALTVLGVGWRRPSLRDIRDRLVEGRHLFASSAAVSLYTNTNVFALGLIAGPTAAGYFSAAYKLVQAALRMVTPVTQSLYPHINAMAARSRDDALRFIRLSLRRIALGSLLLSLAIFFLAEPAVTLLYGKDFAPTVVALRWMAPLPFVIAVATVLGEHTMLTFGMQREFSRILLKAGVLNVVLVVPLCYWLGAVGAAIASLMIEILIALARSHVLRKGGYYLWSLERGYA